MNAIRMLWNLSAIIDEDGFLDSEVIEEFLDDIEDQSAEEFIQGDSEEFRTAFKNLLRALGDQSANYA